MPVAENKSGSWSTIYLAAHRLECQRADVRAVQEDAPLFQIVETGDQAHQRRLPARSGRQGRSPARAALEGELLQRVRRAVW